MLQAQTALGLVALLLLAWSLGEESRLSAWRIAVTGAALQIVLAALMLYLPGLGAAGLFMLDRLGPVKRGFVLAAMGGGRIRRTARFVGEAGAHAR